ncbi:hypothetical protein [Stenotrophomonas sp. YAU14A_MKIMI4_1]|uniref:hypothetical protein n=1 Tax=Stenotrophomonas sp. YAU14A_MKIMI4_1 TaxID=2072408 RepID=UPI001901D69F|nr:hypothetical protein [Stenotrophomonas sp. YAU14A_MKIMI4_1]
MATTSMRKQGCITTGIANYNPSTGRCLTPDAIKAHQMTRNPYSEFLYWLGDSEGSNWNEYICEQVGLGVILRFSQQDWDKLQKTMAHQPSYWLQRCAVSLGTPRHPLAIKILKTLLATDDLDTQIMAAYELDWSEEPIEHELETVISQLISRIPEAERSDYPEVESLLKKSKNQT